MNNYCIYKHTSPNGKVYVGMTKQSPNGRWKGGFGYQSSPHFWNAIQKYGWDNFSHEILLDGLTLEDACYYESYYIALYDSANSEKGYNEKFGGQTGAVFTDDVKKRLSERMKAYYREHPDAVERARLIATGRKHTDEEKAKMRAVNKRRPRHSTEDWKEKIGAGVRKRLSENTELREETIRRCVENGMKNARKVEQYSLHGEKVGEYESTKAAQRMTGIRSGNISKCCNGLAKTSGGYIWQYAN